MTRTVSLRFRLTVIILLPLMFVAVLVGFWQLANAQRTATDVFDRSLLSAALAVANDVAISGGDALSARTRDILANTSGGPVFYHVYAPDGVIVAGYATPPVGIPLSAQPDPTPRYFEAIYLGRDVHGVRLQSTTQIDGFAGVFTTTVWQDAAVRAEFVQDLVQRAMLAISGLILSLGLIVWFGVRFGLRPLTDLQSAIAQRSSDELGPIKRAVPIETQGIVDTLNRLFGQVSRSMTAQSEFISNAAHQLRNPIAGVLAMAEAVTAAPTPEATRSRAKDLLEAAQEASDLSQKLLLLERAKAITPASTRANFNLDEALRDWVGASQNTIPQGLSLALEIDGTLGAIKGDATMLREALRNLIDNAVRHGGPTLRTITVGAARDSSMLSIHVADDGRGMHRDDIEQATERFQQLGAGGGSGLGVSIVDAVVRGHGGTLTLQSAHPGLIVKMAFATAEIASGNA